MKILFPLVLILCLCSSTTSAPARKRVQWEYATIDLQASQLVAPNYAVYGARLFLPGKKAVFLEAKNYKESSFRTYLLNRLGSQGWELVIATGYRGSDEKYILKRQK